MNTGKMRNAARIVRAGLAGAGITLLVGFAVLAQSGPTNVDDHPVKPSRVERLLDKHDCWTSKAPEGVIPGHAIVTLPGDVARYTDADTGFGIWLDGNPGTLHAFCR